MGRMGRRLRWWLCAGSFALLACATTESRHWALGTATIASRESADLSDVIPFRQLSRDDFRAEDPPPDFAQYRGRIGAATCAYILAAPHAKIEVHRQSENRFVATVRALRFQAVMNRGCSWWNEDNGLEADYVLEHEQVHFALFELGARGLNARAALLEAEARASADDPETAARELQDRLRMVLQQATLDVVRRGDDFDRATSFSYDPARQKQWAEQVVLELTETESLASPTGVGKGPP